MLIGHIGMFQGSVFITVPTLEFIPDIKATAISQTVLALGVEPVMKGLIYVAH